MRELILKLAEHSADVGAVLAAVDQSALSRGQLVITPGMLARIAGILTGKDLDIKDVRILPDGAVALSVRAAGMELSYTLRVARFAVEQGRVDGLLQYTEERKNGGLGGALLGLTGQTGLKYALGKYAWAKVDGHSVAISSSNAPKSLRIAFQRVTAQGIVLSIK